MKKIIDKNSNDDSNLSFVDYEKILDELIRSPEGEQKNIFGSYSAKSIKDMQGLIKLMTRENLHLVNLSKVINQIIKFDRPSLNKNIESLESDIQYCQGKLVQLNGSINSSTEEKTKFLQRLGFEHDLNFESRLDQFVFSLPEKIKEILKFLDTSDLSELIDVFYENVAILNPSLGFEQFKLHMIEH